MSASSSATSASHAKHSILACQGQTPQMQKAFSTDKCAQKVVHMCSGQKCQRSASIARVLTVISVI